VNPYSDDEEDLNEIVELDGGVNESQPCRGDEPWLDQFDNDWHPADSCRCHRASR
jgi:hypothetical protein